MLSTLCKNTERGIPLSFHAVMRNGLAGGNAWYPATFLETSSWFLDQICPRSLVLSIFESVNFILTTFPFTFGCPC